MTGSDKPFDRELVKRLNEDVGQAITLATQHSQSQFHRRVVVYTTFSAIEGIIFSLKQQILYFWTNDPDHVPPPAAADLAVLRDESYMLDDRGKARVKKTRTPLAANIRFSYQAMARMNGITCPVDFESAGWRDLKAAMAIRHRVTHPKEAADLDISVEEMRTVARAHVWFMDSHLALLTAARDATIDRSDTGPAKDEGAGNS